MQDWTARIENGKKWLYFAMLSTFLWGFLAHGYCFVHDSFNHDSLAEFNGLVLGNMYKLSSGRFLVPIYRNLFRTDLTLPWLIGILSLVWLGLAVFLVLRIFDIRSKVTAFLIAGIFTANLTVTAIAASYLHDFDSDLFGVFCAVAAVYLWKNVRWGSIWGAFFAVVPLATYQSNISVTVVLVMFVCIVDLLNGKDFPIVFKSGLKAMGMLLLAGAMYYMALPIVSSVTGVSLAAGNANTLDRTQGLTPLTILTYTVQAYQNCYFRLVHILSPYPDSIVRKATALLGAVILVSILLWLFNKRICLRSKLLCIALVCLLPLGMNLTYVLSCGEVHDLMYFALWLFYLLALLIADWLVQALKARQPEWIPTVIHKVPRYISIALVALLLYGNVQTANTLYLKKSLEKDAYLSLMTRVIYDVERTDGYIAGTTPIVFAGLSKEIQPVLGTEKYSEIIGVWGPGSIIMEELCYYQAYFDYILLNPAVMAEYEDWYTMLKDPRVSEMPIYPAEGSIAFLDDILVVRLG